MSVQPLTEAEVKKFMALRPSSSILDAISKLDLKQFDETKRRIPPRVPEEQKRGEKIAPETRSMTRRGAEPHPPGPNQQDGTQRRTPPRGPEEQKRGEKSVPETRSTIRRGAGPHPPGPNQQDCIMSVQPLTEAEVLLRFKYLGPSSSTLYPIPKIHLKQLDGTKRTTPPRRPEEQKRGEKSVPETRSTTRRGAEPRPPGPNQQGIARKTSENLWTGIFNEIQEEELEEGYGDTWTLHFNYNLTNELSPEKRQQGWKVTEKTSFASFTCSHCPHSWTSARIYIVFHYRLRNRAERGQVRMRPFRQQCRECHHKDYVTPKFDENIIEEILMVLIRKIKKNCYHEEERVALGPSQTFLTKPHHEELCEACQHGICAKAEPSAFGISRGTQPRINALTRLMLPASNMVSIR